MQNDDSVVLSHHIGSHAAQQGLSSISGHQASNGNLGLAGEQRLASHLGQHIGNDTLNADCGISHKIIHHTDCGCDRNDWGCDAD